MSPLTKRGEVDEARRLPRDTETTDPLPLSLSRRRETLRKRVLVGALLAVGAVAILTVVTSLVGSFDAADRALIYYTVVRDDLPIDVVERGNLESQDEIKILCEVDDIHGDGIHGTPILWVIPNGSSVKKGDLLVEFASASHQERLDRQILETEDDRAEQIKAKVKYENQITQNETSLAEAMLKVDLADLALKQFEDEDGGTFQIDVQNVELQIQEAQAGKLIEETNLEGVEQLYKLGYRSGGELAQARLNALRAERALTTAISKKKELVEYQYLKTKMELEGQRDSARRNLAQVQRDNEALLAQAKAAMEAADEALKKEEELLERYREQLAKCKIYAPQDGMVAYAVSHSHWLRVEIRVGSPVHPRQPILSLPNLRKMQVKTAVHESVLDDIVPGLPVTVHVDALKDRTYKGTVSTVAVLPDQGSWMSSDTKVYETIITIDEEVEQLKPGMTAVAKIHVDELKDVLCVPVQAIEQIEDRSWCYVNAGDNVEARLVTPGRTNDKFVEVREGLEEGDRVVLNPTAIFDDLKKDRTISPSGDSEEEKSDETPLVPLERVVDSDRAPKSEPERSDGLPDATGGRRVPPRERPAGARRVGASP